MRRLAWSAGGFCGMALAFACGLSPLGCAASAALSLLCALGLLAFPRARPAGWRFFAVSLGLLVGLGWSWLDELWNVRPLDPYDGTTRDLEATARGASRQTGYGVAAEVELTLDGRTCRAMLYGDSGLALRPGDRISGKFRLRRTGTKLGDEALYHGARGFDLRLSVQGKPKVEHTSALPPDLWPAALSEALKERLGLLLPDPERGFETALLTGDRAGLSDALYADMGLAGTRHIFAVSGMHISILLGLLLLLFGGRRLTTFLGLPLLWGFGLCVGLPSSVVRALVMQSFLLLAPVFSRENDPPTSLLTALLLILLPDPRAILDVGLQLSFASAAGILLFARRIFDGVWGRSWCRALWKGRQSWKRALAGVLRAMLSGAAASLSTIPLTLPLQLLYFRQFSIAAPLSSAVLLPLLPLVFALGIVAALLSFLWLPLGAVLAWPLLWLIRWCILLTRVVASIPFAALPADNGYFLIFLLGLYALVLCLLLGRGRCAPWIPAGCLVGLLGLCAGLSIWENRRAALSVTVLDVGQGQCVCLQSGAHAALYDCGGSSDPAETAAQFLQGAGRWRVDLLILSHYDADHAGGIVRLLQRVEIGMLYLPETPDEAGVQAAILEAAAEHGCPVRFVTEDLTLPLGAAYAELYAPVNGGAGNDASVAARFHTDGFDVLLTGDMDAGAEKELIRRHGLRDVEVLVAGHHGAAASTGLAALDSLRPETVLISVGADNAYGHPAAPVLERLRDCGALVYRTDQCGTITAWR